MCIGSFIVTMSHVYLRRILQTSTAVATKSKWPQLLHHPVPALTVQCGDSPRTNGVMRPLPSSRTMMSNHGARKGLHLQNLAEMANQKEHDAAVARREKKKEKTAIRKGGKKGGVTAVTEDGNDEFDDIEEKSKNKTLMDDDDWDDLENDDDDDDDEEFDNVVVLPNPNEAKTKMMTHVENFRNYLKSIRGGGVPNVEMFDDVMVRDAYGVATGDVSVKALAQIVMVSPTLANATCFDPATTKAVVVAIRDTLELNPQAEEGGTGVIKIPIPRISMEVRQQLIQTIHKRAENYRVRVRNHRRKVLDVVKRGVAGRLEGVSKDDAFRLQQEIEVITDTVIKELNKLLERKESEILSIQ